MVSTRLRNLINNSIQPQVAALQAHLSDDEINTVCRQLGHVWRDRQLPPGVTVRSLVYRSLHQDKSIRAVLADLASAGQDIACEVTDSAWRQARSRLPEDLLDTLIRRSDSRLADMVAQQYFMWGRPIFLVDSTMISMPDTPDLVEEFGHTNLDRPGRSEPRLIKRVKRRYPDLTTTRQRAREGLS